jgi:hypothetical protein
VLAELEAQQLEPERLAHPAVGQVGGARAPAHHLERRELQAARHADPRVLVVVDVHLEDDRIAEVRSGRGDADPQLPGLRRRLAGETPAPEGEHHGERAATHVSSS